MVKSYLRYVLGATHGIIASPGCNIELDSAGGALFTGQLERVGVWSVKRGTEVRALSAGGTDDAVRAEVTSLAASPVSPHVAAGYSDGMIRVFDFTSGAVVVVLSGHKKAVSALRYSADGTRLASGARDTDVILWDVVAEVGLCRFKGHKDEVTAVSFLQRTPGELLIVSCSKDTLIKVWDPRAHSCVQTIVGTRTEVWSLSVVPAGDRVVVGAGDNQLRVFTVNFPEQPQQQRHSAAPASSSSALEAGAASSSSAVEAAAAAAAASEPASSSHSDEPLSLLGTVTRQSSDRVSSIRCCADGVHVGVQSAGKLIEVLRRRTPAETRKRVQRRLRRHREKLGKRAKSSAELAAATAASGGGGDGTEEDGSSGALLLAGTTLADIDAVLARLEEDAERERAALAGGGRATLSVDPAARSAAVGRATHSPYVIASDEWELVGIVSAGHRLSSFVFLPPQQHGALGVRGGTAAAPARAPLQLVASTHDNRVELYSLQRDAESATLEGDGTITLPSGTVAPQAGLSRSFTQAGHRSDVRAVAVSTDGTMLLTASAGQAKVWNSKTGACVRTLDFSAKPLAVFSDEAAGGGEDGDGDEEDEEEGAAARGRTASSSSVVGLCAAFGPGGKHAIVGLKDGRLLLFNLSSGDLLESHKAHASAVWSLTVRPDESGCATGGADKEVRFWDFDLSPAAAPGGALKQLSLVHSRTLKLSDEVLCVKYSRSKDPAKLLIAVALLDATVKIFFDDSLKFFLSMYGHKLPVMAMDISADSTLLVTASADKNVKLWGLDFGDLHRSFLAHADSVMAVAFVANTHYFFTAGKDRAIKYWDGDRFEHILTLNGHKGEVWGLAVAPDGTFLASASHDRSIRVWRRTDEQVFLDEEREKEFEHMLESTLKDPDGEAVLGGEDEVGPVGQDGIALIDEGEQPGQAGKAAGGVVTMPGSSSSSAAGSGMEAVSTVVAHATRDTMRGGERLLEALALAAEEADKWREYGQDVAAAVAAGDGEGAVDPPARNLLLLGLTPAEYVLREMRSLRPTDVDQVLLVLPFSDAVVLLRFLHYLLTVGRGVELCCRAALLLLRVHASQIAASAALLPLMVSLQEAMHAAVASQKRRVSVNIAALRMLDRALQSEAASAVFGPPVSAGSSAGGAGGRGGSAQRPKGVTVGKRKNVQLL